MRLLGAAGTKYFGLGKTAAEKLAGAQQAGGKGTLNTATAAELTALLHGVRSITAQRILGIRAAHGFASIEDVMRRSKDQ